MDVICLAVFMVQSISILLNILRLWRGLSGFAGDLQLRCDSPVTKSPFTAPKVHLTLNRCLAALNPSHRDDSPRTAH